ncbi:ParA family protein [Reichenbachiella ulvae]|uniref:ParA family protein n=1 Tax=Reichenbachiella ulvae TaxID=2980104 RepID=A0ABT3D147_9BACT|nr:ParA family protein [Reichenbachiella ulvae]MCV9389158.1 ParA family protein [Reichenbachiella ulvae]
MSIIISIANEKGGVAKTTSTGSIGSILSRLNYKVILVDLDPQADLTISLDVEAEDRNIFDCLFHHKKIVANKVNENLILVGGDPRLTPLDFMDSIKNDKDFQIEDPRLILKSLLKQVTDKADFILMDCPPNREIITQNALAASDYVLIPSEAHNFSVNGINNIIENLDAIVSAKLNTDLKLLGLFVTRYRKNTAIHSDMVEWFETNYHKDLFKTKINENITIQEATQMGRELSTHDDIKRSSQLVKKSSPFKGLADYRELVNEILNRIQNEPRKV